MKIDNRSLEDWIAMESDIKKSWMKQNKNDDLRWEDVKESVRLGWFMAKHMDDPVESIH